MTRRFSLPCVRTASTPIYSTGTCNPGSQERKKLGLREWTKNPMEGTIGLHSHGVRRRKKGQIRNFFRITGKVKDTGCFLFKHRKNGANNVRDHRRTEQQKQTERNGMGWKKEPAIL